VSAGLIAVLVGVVTSAAIVFTAAEAAGAGPRELSSWMLALGVGMGVTCIGLSLRYKAPVVTAWSTPGAALLVSGLRGVAMAQAVGAFIVSAALSGLTGWFERMMGKIPVPLAAGLLAGVLVPFGTGLFAGMDGHFAVVFSIFAVCLLGRRLLPRYAITLALAVGVAVAAAQGSLRPGEIRFALAEPVFTAPVFSLQVIVSVALPLFVVTMASRNPPGVAVLRGDGYDRVPVSPLITWTGFTNLLLAPFGCFGLKLAAITHHGGHPRRARSTRGPGPALRGRSWGRTDLPGRGHLRRNGGLADDRTVDHPSPRHRRARTAGHHRELPGHRAAGRERAGSRGRHVPGDRVRADAARCGVSVWGLPAGALTGAVTRGRRPRSSATHL
jgi:benzoate membrane transport protein